MYPKHITERIVELWALGFTAEETRTAISEQYKNIGLATVYRHRHNLTAKNLIDELLRHQERAILKANADNPVVAMKYRNELLKILLPQRIEAYSVTKEVIENRDITIVADYTKAISDAANRDIQSLRAKQQMDTTEPSSTTT